MTRALSAGLLAGVAMTATAAAQEAAPVADWVDPSGVVRLTYERLGWAGVQVSPRDDLGLMPHAVLAMIAPGGAYDWAAASPQAHCLFTAPLLGYWPAAPAMPSGQAEANAQFQGGSSLESWPGDNRWITRDGVLIAAYEREEGEAVALGHSFMLATEDGPLLHVLACTAPMGDEAAVAAAREILARMRFSAAPAGEP